MATAYPSTNTNSSTENDLFFLESEKNQRPKRRHSITNCQYDYNQERNGNSNRHRRHSKISTLDNSFRNQASSPKHGSHIQMCSNFENRNSRADNEHEANRFCLENSNKILDNHNIPQSSFDLHNIPSSSLSESFKKCLNFTDEKNHNDLLDLNESNHLQAVSENSGRIDAFQINPASNLDNTYLENSKPQLPNPHLKRQSQRNESKSKTGNLDRKLLNESIANSESTEAVILDNRSDRLSLDFDNSKNDEKRDDQISKKYERPKSLTLDYRYLKRAKHPNDFGDSRRFFERSDQFENRFFHKNSIEQLRPPQTTNYLTNEYLQPSLSNLQEFGHTLNSKIEHLRINLEDTCNGKKEHSNLERDDRKHFHPLQNNSEEFGQNEYSKPHQDNFEEVACHKKERSNVKDFNDSNDVEKENFNPSLFYPEEFQRNTNLKSHQQNLEEINYQYDNTCEKSTSEKFDHNDCSHPVQSKSCNSKGALLKSQEKNVVEANPKTEPYHKTHQSNFEEGGQTHNGKNERSNSLFKSNHDLINEQLRDVFINNKPVNQNLNAQLEFQSGECSNKEREHRSIKQHQNFNGKTGEIFCNGDCQLRVELKQKYELPGGQHLEAFEYSGRNLHGDCCNLKNDIKNFEKPQCQQLENDENLHLNYDYCQLKKDQDNSKTLHYQQLQLLENDEEKHHREEFTNALRYHEIELLKNDQEVDTLHNQKIESGLSFHDERNQLGQHQDQQPFDSERKEDECYQLTKDQSKGEILHYQQLGSLKQGERKQHLDACQLKKSQADLIKCQPSQAFKNGENLNLRCQVNKDEGDLRRNRNCYDPKSIDKCEEDCNNCSGFTTAVISKSVKCHSLKTINDQLGENFNDPNYKNPFYGHMDSKSPKEFCLKPGRSFDNQLDCLNHHENLQFLPCIKTFQENENENMPNCPEKNLKPSNPFYLDENERSKQHLRNKSSPVSEDSFLKISNQQKEDDIQRFDLLHKAENHCSSLQQDNVNMCAPVDYLQDNYKEDDLMSRCIQFCSLQKDNENMLLPLNKEKQFSNYEKDDVIFDSLQDRDKCSCLQKNNNCNIFLADGNVYSNYHHIKQDDDSFSINNPNIMQLSNFGEIDSSNVLDEHGHVLVDVDSGFETTPIADFLGLNETTCSENEAMDVLLKLDEVLNECLKETSEATNSLADCGEDFVNKIHDEYRLSRQISLEELEGKMKGQRVDGLLGNHVALEKAGSLRQIKILDLDNLLINSEDCESDNINLLPMRISFEEDKNYNLERFQGDDYSKEDKGGSNLYLNQSEGDDNGNSKHSDNNNSELSRVVKLQELEGKSKIEVMQYCLRADEGSCSGSSNAHFEDDSSKQDDEKEPDDIISINRDDTNKDITIEECLHDLDEYLRAFDDESCSSLSSANVAAGKSYCNLGYINSELDRTESDTPQRPLSSCGSRTGALTRNHAYRATIGAIKCGGGEERAMVLHRSDNPSARRTSVADGDEVIDWSWLNDVEGADNVEIIENHRPSTSVVVEDSMATGDAKRPIWLRTSMRRLQPLPLPTNVDNADHAPATSSAMDNLAPTDTNFATGNGRPISAPSRLPSVQRSRSRDRTSQNPAGRARSSSASSRSRRPRSLSSSVSSVVSSVDSTPTCTPTPVQTYNTNITEEANNNNNNVRSFKLGFLDPYFIKEKQSVKN